MDVTLELDTRYHERQKEKGGNKEKKPLVLGSNPSRPPQGSSLKRPHHKKNNKGKQFQSSKYKPHAALLNKNNKFIVSEKGRRIKEGLCTYCGGKNPIEKCFKRPQNKPGSIRGFPSKQGNPDILIDSGAKSTFISKKFFPKYSLTISELPENIPLLILYSNESPALFITHYTKWVVDFPSFQNFEWDFFIIDSPKGEDLILDYYFLYHFNPITYWKNVLITYDSSHKDSSGINSSASNNIATHHACDHHMELEDLLPPVGFIYSLSNQESETLQAYISENVEKVFIFPSSSSTRAPVLFVKKKDGGLCLCFDYLKLNDVTRKNGYSVPPINQLFTVFNGSTIFSKIDLHGAYNLLRIKEGDEHLTAFRPKYGIYEYLVMPFGPTNSPSSFQNLLNDIFSDFLDIFAVVYLEDIMVFSSSEEEHVRHVASILQKLRDNNSFSKA
ncbi:hypothetical protein O181_006210 [Austropuccinia psidii MF-1]|uniref:Reverse transcriptase domain-containing protein n=1 Tax=Austropuccinia psidii MF-1 TaxID=1389203 RepID=A0A9Q3GGL7_9BASI|nr:hypothetical protein [Austropuccinia psidii MF-1]